MLKRILLPALFSMAWLIGISQQSLPVLQADSTLIKIKIDGNIVAIWNIDPDTKPWTEPDVFAIERSFGLSLSMLWAAIFPMHHELHGAASPIPVFQNAGVLLSVEAKYKQTFFE